MYRDDDVLVYMNIIAVGMAAFAVILWLAFQFMARRRRTKLGQRPIPVQACPTMTPSTSHFGNSEHILKDDLSVREAERPPCMEPAAMTKREIASNSLTLPRYLQGNANAPATIVQPDGSKPVESTRLDLQHSWDLRQIAHMSDRNLQEFFKTVSYQDALFIISRLGVRWQAVMLGRLHLNKAVAKKIKVSLHKAVT